MKTFQIINGDLVLKGNDIEMVEGENEIVQAAERILTTNKGEFFLDVEFGLEYSQIQGKGKDKETIRFTILEAINQDSRVTEVQYVNVDIDRLKRELIINYRYTTKEGNVEGQEVLAIG